MYDFKLGATGKPTLYRDIAAALGSSSSTVKTHLSALFSKTDTCRRADLVKAVLAYGDPLR